VDENVITSPYDYISAAGVSVNTADSQHIASKLSSQILSNTKKEDPKYGAFFA
jgi:hypothetical protein